MEEPDYTKERIDHLEMIQGIVTRLANTSAAMKRYCLVLVAAAGALSKLQNMGPILGFTFLVLVFWAFDARYLQQERWFRALHDEVRAEAASSRPDFRLTPTHELRQTARYGRCLVSWSTLFFYVPLLLIIAWWSAS